MVQVGTQNRSSAFLRRVFDRLRGGELGAIRFAHALVYRARDGIGSVDAPTPPPRTVDYDLWCGPAPLKMPHRKSAKYGSSLPAARRPLMNHVDLKVGAGRTLGLNADDLEVLEINEPAEYGTWDLPEPPPPWR